MIVPLAVVAQPIVGMTAGMLSRLGHFDVFGVYFTLLATAIGGDVVWYFVGHRYGERFARRFGRFLSITPDHIEEVKRIFHRYHTSVLLISKVTNGFGLAIVVLFTAGLTRIPFWRYIVLNIIGEAVWSAFIVSVGYFLGTLYVEIDDVIGKVTVLALFVIFALMTAGFFRYMRNRVEKEIQERKI